MKRKLEDVIDAMRAAIPETETGHRARLDWIQRDAAYRAPEVQGVSWQFLAQLVGEFADPVKCPPQPGTWQLNAVCALTGRTPEDILGAVPAKQG